MNQSNGAYPILARIGRFIFARRLLAGCGVAAIGAFIVQPDQMFCQHRFLAKGISFGIICLGLALRGWGSGVAGGHTRTCEIEAPRLATGGPYAYLRNPIYLGSMFLGLGMIGALGDWRLFFLYIPFFIIFFLTIVRAEEEFLLNHFGGDYRRYREAVPSIVPRLKPWDGQRRVPFNWHSVRGEIHIATVLVIIYAVMKMVIALRA